MRILCLHGHGANAQVSKAHVAPLLQRLRREYESPHFEHLEGHIESSPYPGVDEYFSPPFFHFFRGNDPSSILEGALRVKATFEKHGPFDGVFAFSEGAAAFLSALVQHELQLQFMILVAPTPPFDLAGRRRLDIKQTKEPIFDIPAMLIQGQRDVLRTLTQMVRGLLDNDKTLTLEWDGGHEVPNSGENWLWDKVVTEIAKISTK